MLRLEISEIINEVYDEIITLPFYQDGDTYKYSRHLLVGEGNESKYLEFVSADPEAISHQTGGAYKEYLRFFNDAMNELNSIEIPKEEYEDWLFSQKESEAIQRYKNTVHNIHGELNRLVYMSTLGNYYPSASDSASFDKVLEYGGSIGSSMMTDLDEVGPTSSIRQMNDRRVLNKNNPFADISIEDQKFLYADDSGAFKVLELNTSYTLTKIQKDDIRSFIALQPGFKIRISSNLAGKNSSDIIFDDTLTTEIAQDDKAYIYLDGLQE